jgi:hypothetical protein
MPYLTEFIDEGTGILHVGSGVLKGQEIIKVVMAMAGKVPHPERVTHGLIDLTEVTDFQVSTEELKVITGVDRTQAETMKRIYVAIVAPKDVAYGMSRMYEGLMLTPGWTIEIFRTMNQARTWLSTRLSAENPSLVEGL